MRFVYAGQIFTRLTVIGSVSPNRWGKPRVECRCVCGKTVIACENDLTRNTKSTKSCGCYNRDCTRQRNHQNCETKHSRFRKLAGVKQKHGRLTAVQCVGFSKNFRHARWECRCDCGNTVVVDRGRFLQQTTRSCGCLKDESDNNRFGTNNPYFKTGEFVKEVRTSL